MRKSLAVLLTILLTSATLLAGAPEGKAVYKKKCQTCHGADGAGNAKLAKMLKVEFKHLGSPEVQKLSDAEMAKIIKEGIGKMKPVKGLTDQQIQDVIAFVRTLKK